MVDSVKHNKTGYMFVVFFFIVHSYVCAVDTTSYKRQTPMKSAEVQWMQVSSKEHTCTKLA